MTEEKKKKVLIVGTGAKVHALCLKFRECENVGDVFVLPGNAATAEVAQRVDIRERDVEGILKFAIDSEIDLTVVFSEDAIKQDIAGVFQANGQLIFAPTAESASFATDKAFGKKFLYKQRIPTPRFGIFEKLQPALDYIKSANFPQIVRATACKDDFSRQTCQTQTIAKMYVEDFFARDEKQVILEDYIYGHSFTLYVVTDGYHALPLNTVADYCFAKEGDGGRMTCGVGAYAPDYNVSFETVDFLMQNVVANALQALQFRQMNYLGILGVNCVLRDDGRCFVTDFTPFLQDHDAMTVLELLDENIYTLFEACAVGSFADDYEMIGTSPRAAISCVLSALQQGEVISGLDGVENSLVTHFHTHKNSYLEYETPKGAALVLTASANTLNRARKKLYEDIESVDFKGKIYRKDIGLERVLIG